jgi:hypothetical protein
MFRIESSHPIASPFIGSLNKNAMVVADRGVAVALAAKSFTLPRGKEIRVVHTDTGEIVFRKTGDAQGVTRND